MLKTVSSITNAIGALNYKGTWNASTNTPTIVSSTGTKGDYYVVSVAGTTTIDGVSNWGVGDWITFNGSVWQRVEGGADLNGVNLSVSGTTTLSGLTASTALALNASKEMVSVTNTGTGDNVLATAPTLVGDVTLSTGNLVVADTKGIDFSATPGTGTSELFDDYEEGTWTPIYTTTGTNFTSVSYSSQAGYYIKVGGLVFISGELLTSGATKGSASGNVAIGGLPFTATQDASISLADTRLWAGSNPSEAYTAGTIIILLDKTTADGGSQTTLVADFDAGATKNLVRFAGCYYAA